VRQLDEYLVDAGDLMQAVDACKIHSFKCTAYEVFMRAYRFKSLVHGQAQMANSAVMAVRGPAIRRAFIGWVQAQEGESMLR